MRCALYLRVSSEDQKTIMQLDDLKRYAELRQWVITEIYEDHLTGTNDKRPAFQRMLRDAHERRFDILCVWKFDRFSRNLRDLVVNIQRLQDLGIEFCSFKDQIDMSTPHGKLFAHMIMAFSQFVAESIKMRVKAGMDSARARGKHIGRPRTVDHGKVLELRSQGQSLTSIAKKLNISRAAVSAAVKKAPGAALATKGAR